MDSQEYEKRAVPRLTLIDALDKRCQWDKFDCQVSFDILEIRKRRKILMDEQNADEVSAGL